MKANNINDFYYGMKRYFDIGCQPAGQKGLVSPELLKAINKHQGTRFMDVVRYEEELSKDEQFKYELALISNEAIKEIVKAGN